MADPTFQIPKDVIEPIIQAHVASAVTAALGDRSAIVQAAVGKVLNTKVDSDGVVNRYDSYNSVPWIQWVMNDCVKKAARAAIEEALQIQAPTIKAMIAKELANKKSPLVKKLIEALAGTLEESSLKYRLNVTVEDK